MQYHNVIISGTFDHIHRGHETLLHKSFAIGDHVSVCVTSDVYIRKFKGDKGIQSYTARKKELQLWLGKYGYNNRVTIIPIDDPFGPSIDKKYTHDAIVVSKETYNGAEAVNRKRILMGLPVLAVITMPMVSAKDNKTISSTRIRENEIDRIGNLVLPKTLRQVLQKPFGTVYTNGQLDSQLKEDKEKVIISIGDYTTKVMLDHGISPRLAIIDMQAKRQPFHWEKSQFAVLTHGISPFPIQSGPGYISQAALLGVHDALKNKKGRGELIIIDGEEDLLVLPAILEAPLGSVVYYGQPNIGAVRVLVTTEKKQEADRYLQKFLRKE